MPRWQILNSDFLVGAIVEGWLFWEGDWLIVRERNTSNSPPTGVFYKPTGATPADDEES